MNYVHVVDDDLNREIFLLDNVFDDEDDEQNLLEKTTVHIDYNFEDDE